jgi:hypothetical protein
MALGLGEKFTSDTPLLGPTWGMKEKRSFIQGIT